MPGMVRDFLAVPIAMVAALAAVACTIALSLFKAAVGVVYAIWRYPLACVVVFNQLTGRKHTH